MKTIKTFERYKNKGIEKKGIEDNISNFFKGIKKYIKIVFSSFNHLRVGNITIMDTIIDDRNIL